MNRFILGGFLLVATLFYLQSGDNTVTSTKDAQMVQNIDDKFSDMDDIIVVDKTLDSKFLDMVKKVKTIKTKSNISHLTSKKVVTKQTISQLYKTNRPKATYQQQQSYKRYQAIQRAHYQKLYKQRAIRQQQLSQRDERQRQMIAAKSIQSQRIHKQRTQRLNYRYKSQMQQRRQQNISKNKKLNNIS